MSRGFVTYALVHLGNQPNEGLSDRSGSMGNVSLSIDQKGQSSKIFGRIRSRFAFYLNPAIKSQFHWFKNRAILCRYVVVSANFFILRMRGQ